MISMAPFANRFGSKGYSLVEMSIVLAIIALVSGLTLSIGRTQLQVADIQGTQQRLELIKQAGNLGERGTGNVTDSLLPVQTLNFP